MNTTRKVLLSVLVVGAIGSVVALGAFSAFSGTTSNPNNNFTAGNVTITDNDAGNFMYQVTNGKPGTTNDACIKVTYTGSLDSNVRLYATNPISGSGANFINLTVTPVTFAGAPPAFPSCTGAANDGAAIYNGSASGMPTTFGAGAIDFPGTGTKWATNDAVYYKFSTSVQDTNAAQNATTGLHSFTWEAQNQ